MYILIRNKQKLKTDEIPNLDGYRTLLKKRKILIVKQDLIDYYLSAKFMPALEKIYQKIIRFLNDEDDEESSGMLLDELARERAVILNKYEKYLSDELIDNYMRNIRLLANELKLREYDYIRNIENTKKAKKC